MTTGPESSPLDGTAWVLSSLPDGTLVTDRSATARFEFGRVQGSDGCNRYAAQYTTNGSAIEIGPRAASTQMACPSETMKQAEAFMTALSSAKRYRFGNGQLQLLAGDGSVLMSLGTQSQSLAGTSWRVIGINTGKAAVSTLVANSTVTMAFTADGKVSGSAGCNQYTSTYESGGSKLRFAPAAVTRRMCVAAGAMEQEHAFFNALESVATMRMDGDRLEMRTAEGALAINLIRNIGP